MNRFVVPLSVIIVAFFGLSSCTHQGASVTKEVAETTLTKPRAFARAELIPRSKSTARGVVLFSIVPEGLKVYATVKKVKPVGLHGFHMHEVGDCSAADASSAGGHYNPLQQKHGDAHHEHSHLGDFGNIQVDASGHGEIGFIIERAKADEKVWQSIIGKSVVLHADPDDLKSQPAGNSGSRIACGVIKKI